MRCAAAGGSSRWAHRAVAFVRASRCRRSGRASSVARSWAHPPREDNAFLHPFRVRRRVTLRLVSLDLDGTLIHPAIFNVVADKLGFGEPLQRSYREYVAGTMSLEDAFHHDFKFFVGRAVDEMSDVLADSSEWTPGIQRAVTRLKDAGLRVIVTTDQPRFLAECTKRFGVEDVVCSEAEVKHGRVTANVVPQFEKWPNLERHLKARGIDPAEVVHVGNGTNDIPVFERVGYAIAVNPLDPRVSEAADVTIARVESLELVADAILKARATP